VCRLIIAYSLLVVNPFFGHSIPLPWQTLRKSR
jgi:hypothetical protein